MTARDRIVLLVVAALVLVVGTWELVIQPRRDQASKLASQISAAQASLTSARAQMRSAELAKAASARSYTTLVQLGEAVPPDDNVPSLIYQLQSAASASGVDFSLLKLAPKAGATGTAPSSTSGSPGQAPSLPPGATVGSAGFPTLSFTFTFQGNFFHLADFFARLQHFVMSTRRGISVSGRLMTLNAISLEPAPHGFPQMTATVSATTYLLPAAQGLVNGVTPPGPSSTSAGSSGPSSSSTTNAPGSGATPPPAAAATAP